MLVPASAFSEDLASAKRLSGGDGKLLGKKMLRDKARRFA
jgi:hypothetical protein